MTERERSTARFGGRFDLSPTGSRASASPAPNLTRQRIREDERWVQGVRSEPCSCGGTIVQYLGETPADLVRVHNATPEHQAWRHRG
jgi:hypothetical protein